MDISPSEAGLRAKLYELDVAMDAARADDDADRLVELAGKREEIVAQLRALLPADAELGTQHNEDRDYDKAAFVDTPILIQGDGSEHG